MSRKEELLAEVLALSTEDRRYIVEQVCDTFDEECLEELRHDPRFLEELDRRFFDGKPRIPWEEVRKALRKSP